MPRILLDTDPGIDDALALFLALASPEVQLEAITTVHGNVPVELTTRNALSLLEVAGRADIPVARGSAQPLVRSPVDAKHVHGPTGLGTLTLPEPQINVVKPSAPDLIIERVLAAPGELTLVPIGPLTNLALALRREPAIVSQVREVVIMGGALRVPGNITPAAEFNIYADPHAAHIVFKAGWPIRLVSLDATNLTVITREQTRQLARNGSPITRCIEQMLEYYFDAFAPKFGNNVLRLHDPLYLAAAFRPDFIQWEPAYVDVELNGTLTLGETVAFFQRPDAPAPNVQASVGVDAERFVAWFLERLA
ncbi:MAG TPA: nucleoside hydrolase [Ktedonobacterales bacterium]|jgi:purine nucleosidase